MRWTGRSSRSSARRSCSASCAASSGDDLAGRLIAGIWLAFRFAVAISASVPLGQEWPLARTAAVALLIVVSCVFAAALVGWLVRELVKAYWRTRDWQALRARTRGGAGNV